MTVFIPKKQGQELARITDGGVEVSMQITPGKRFTYASDKLNKSVPSTYLDTGCPVEQSRTV